MPKTYSVKEAAAILGFSTNTIYSFLNTKKLKGLRVGKGKFRIPQSEIDRMTGSSSASTAPVAPVAIVSPRQHSEESLIFRQHIPYLHHLSLTDWYIGLGSIIFGLSMFVYTASIESVISMQLTSWYWVLRFVFIVFGVGFLTAKLFVKVPPSWVTVFQCLLIAAFGWFVVVSHLAHDPQGTVVGFFVCLIMIMQLLIAPAYHSLIAGTILGIAIMNTILFVFFPSYLASINASFGIMSVAGVWGQLATFIVPYVLYLLLVVSHRFSLKLYYFLIILGSFACHFGAYVTGVNLYWHQGLVLLFTGVMLFIYATWQTTVMKVYKKTWITGTVLGFVFVMFFAIILSLRVFELTMYDHANRELQVKVENGKLYLETIFGYAKNTFRVSGQTSTIGKAIETKDRKTVTAFAKNMYDQFPHMYRITVLDKEGTEVANYPEDAALTGRNYAYRSYFQDALVQNDTVFSDVLQTTGTVKQYSIVVATPIVEQGVVYGVLAGAFDMDEIGRNVQSFTADEHGEYFAVLDEKGVQIINPDSTVIGTSIPPEERAKFTTIPFWKTHLDTKVNAHGALVLSTYRTVNFANLNIETVEPYKENLQAHLIALLVTVIVSAYGYLATLITWYVCYRKSKTGKAIE